MTVIAVVAFFAAVLAAEIAWKRAASGAGVHEAMNFHMCRILKSDYRTYASARRNLQCPRRGTLKKERATPVRGAALICCHPGQGSNNMTWSSSRG